MVGHSYERVRTGLVFVLRLNTILGFQYRASTQPRLQTFKICLKNEYRVGTPICRNLLNTIQNLNTEYRTRLVSQPSPYSVKNTHTKSRRNSCVVYKSLAFLYCLQGFYKHDQKQHEERIKDLDSPVECPSCEKMIETKRMLNVHFEKGIATFSSFPKSIFTFSSFQKRYRNIFFLS